MGFYITCLDTCSGYQYHIVLGRPSHLPCLLNRTADFFSPVVEVQNTTLGATRHRLQVGQSVERRLHSYVDYNSSGCYSVYEPTRGAPRSTGTLPSPQPALMLPFVRCQAQPNEVPLLPIEIHLTLRTPWASGYAHTPHSQVYSCRAASL